MTAADSTPRRIPAQPREHAVACILHPIGSGVTTWNRDAICDAHQAQAEALAVHAADEDCEHGLAAWLCAGPGSNHYPADL